MSNLSPEQRTAIDWVAENRDRLSSDHLTIWRFAEPAWREYRSARWYVERLRAEGFEVEEGSGGMPTAFCATYGRSGPIIGSYAEYDAVPGTSQNPVPYREPRPGLHPSAAGHTDPHSALGIAALGGILAAKAAIDRHNLEGRLKFFGEPAEKMCGSKPVHAAKGYYDDLDAAISFHPSYIPGLSNTAVWDTHCGCYWSKIYAFECISAETWSADPSTGSGLSHATARAPGAIDAICLMYTTTKYTKEAMLPNTGTWTLNEAILNGGQATSDNLPPRLGMIQYAWRCPTLDMARRIEDVLDQNARHVARLTHTELTEHVVTRTRVGLPNHALARSTYETFERVGPPVFGPDAHAFAREVQKTLGLEPMAAPLAEDTSELLAPEEAEAIVRRNLPPWQINYTSDDYVDYTWHAPTVRLYVGRPRLKAPEPGYRYPHWVHCAMGGVPALIDPMIETAAKVIGGTIVDLLLDRDRLAACQAEFRERTGGGINGTRWSAPLLASDFRAPVDFPWPEYVSTVRGDDWCVPMPAR